MSTKVWSPYQEAFFKAVKTTIRNLMLLAVAGSGKTTTIVKALEFCVGRWVFLAFNKAIQEELRTRVPSHVEVKTLHAFGMGILFRNLKVKPQIEQNKMGFIAAKVLGDKRHPLNTVVKNVSSMAKNALADSVGEIIGLMEYHGVEVPGNFTHDDVAIYVIQALKMAKRETATIDFDDMIWLPVVLELPFPRYDGVMGDEVQDFNAVQMEMVARIVGKEGRAIFVGDPRQSIYGFRGADSDAMDKLADRFNVKKLPLSISYRCPQEVVRVAKGMVPEIEASPTAIKGDTSVRSESDLKVSVLPDDMILCRVTKHLVSMYFVLLRAGIKAYVKGRDIGQGLIKFVESFKATDLKDLIEKMTEFKDEEVQKLIDRNKEGQAQQVSDKVDALLEISLNARDIPGLIGAIEAIFQQNGAGVCLSTIHKAKGLEANRVWILHPELLPHPSAKREHERKQEVNLAYVAVTRSKCSLFFVDYSPSWAGVIVDERTRDERK